MQQSGLGLTGGPRYVKLATTSLLKDKGRSMVLTIDL